MRNSARSRCARSDDAGFQRLDKLPVVGIDSQRRIRNFFQ